MRVCIVGAGAIGGWIGGRLARAGHDVSALARGDNGVRTARARLSDRYGGGSRVGAGPGRGIGVRSRRAATGRRRRQGPGAGRRRQRGRGN